LAAEAVSMGIAFLALLSSILVLAYAFTSYYNTYTAGIHKLLDYTRYISQSCLRIVWARYNQTPVPHVEAKLLNCGSTSIVIDSNTSVIILYRHLGVLREDVPAYGSGWLVNETIINSIVQTVPPGQPVSLEPGELALLKANLTLTPDSSSPITIYIANSMGVRCSYVLSP